MIRVRRLATSAFAAIAVFVLVAACTSPGRLPAAHVASVPVAEPQAIDSTSQIKVVSLNAAHSRSMGLHQVFQSSDTARVHLNAMVAMLERENPDVVALQEVDGPSIWSGKFDHVDYLAREAGYSATVRGTHMKAPGLDYGTAIMARQPLYDSASIGFGSALSLARKGFVISQMQWPGRLDTQVDLVSVHLDPLSSRVRERQVAALIAIIEERGRPVIVMGDFNDDWYDEDSSMRQLGEFLQLKPHGVRCEECHTHRRLKNFVDWILVSPELSIEDFQILDDDISDHYAVSATLSLNDSYREQGTAAH